MRKILFLSILFITLFVFVTPSEAAFWSKWLNKNTTQNNTTSVSSQTKPVDKNDVVRRWNILQSVFLYPNNAQNLDVSFTEEEIRSVGLPLINEQLKKISQVNGTTITDIKISNGSAEIFGEAGKPINGKVSVVLSARARNGAVQFEILKAKYRGFPIPKFIIDGLLSSYNIKPEALSLKMKSFDFTNVALKDKVLSIKGQYLTK